MTELDRPIFFTKHAREKMADRGVSEEDVTKALRIGQREATRRGLWQYRVNLEFHREWGGKYYAV